MKKILKEWHEYLNEQEGEEPDRPTELDVPSFPQCPDGTREVEQKDKSIKCFDVDNVLVGIVPGGADAGPTPSPPSAMKQILDREARWRNNVKDINNRTINKGDWLIIWPKIAKGRTYECIHKGCDLIKVVDVGAPYMLGAASVTIKGMGRWDNRPWSWPSLQKMALTTSRGGEFLKITDKLTSFDIDEKLHTEMKAEGQDRYPFFGTINKDGEILIRRPAKQFERTITPKAYKFIKDIAKEANKYDRVDVRSYLKLIYENVPGGVGAVERVSRKYGGDPTTQGVVLVYRSTAMKDVQWPDFITMRPGWENVKKDPGFWMKLQAQAYNIRMDATKTILNIFKRGVDRQGFYIAGRAPIGSGMVGLAGKASPKTTHHEIGHHINPWGSKYLPYWPQEEIEPPERDKSKGIKKIVRKHDRQIAELQAEHLALIKHYWATKGKLAKTPKEAERQIKEFVDKHEPKGYIYNMLRNRTYRRKLRLLYLQTVYNTPKKAKTMMAKYVAQQQRMVAEQSYLSVAGRAAFGSGQKTARTYSRVKKIKKRGKAALDPTHIGRHLVKSYGGYAPDVLAQAVKSRADAPEYEVGRGALAGCIFTPRPGKSMRFQCKGKCPNAGEEAPDLGSAAEEEWKAEWGHAVYTEKRCRRVCKPGLVVDPLNLGRCVRKR